MRTNKNTPKIVLAIAVALLATLISYSIFSSMRKELREQKKLIEVMQKTSAIQRKADYAYAVSAKELKAGEIVSESDVDFKNFITANTSAFENRSDIVNKVLLKNIMPGEMFTSSHIAKITSDNSDLQEGYRALTLPAENFQGKSKTMNAGSVIDIYSSSADSNWFLEGIKILGFESNKKTSSTDTTKPSDIGILDASSITFEVPVAYVPDFISNISKSKLVLVTRGENDRKIKRIVKKSDTSYEDYESSNKSLKSLPKLPGSIPTLESSVSDLPTPIQPIVQGPSVEVIEANVKSKVTFD